MKSRARFPQFNSLRSRALWPFAFVSVSVVVCVLLASHKIADWHIAAEQNRRFEAISTTLADTSFPLAQNVLDTVARLIDAQMMTTDAEGRILKHTLNAGSNEDVQIAALANLADGSVANLGSSAYRLRRFSRHPVANGSPGSQVVLLFDESERIAAQRRFAWLPLVAGLSTTVLLSGLALTISSRLIGRIQRLKARVAQIASGDFSQEEPDPWPDELGQLSRSVEQMRGELEHLWSAVNRSERERLIHQLGAGLAHQLRNSLTGAKMAVELHARQCPERESEDLGIALREMTRTESDLQRILQLGKSEISRTRREPCRTCIEDALAGAQPFAKHLHVSLESRFLADQGEVYVDDGQALRSAINNLILNAIQAGGTRVVLQWSSTPSEISIQVRDNGNGPPAEIADELFEPFISSKPEGLGLGLALVRRCAEALGGSVQWERTHDETIFTLQFAAAWESKEPLSIS